MKIFNRKSLAAFMVLAIAGTLIALPTMGSDSEHETLSIESIEAKILNDNVAVQRAELDFEMKQDELVEAEDNKSDSGSSTVETHKNRRYYTQQAEMNLYVSEKSLESIKQTELLRGVNLYYDYLLIVKEIDIQNATMLRLNDELAAVNKKIELGVTTLNTRTTKELEVSKANYALTQLQNSKETLFLDMNLALQQDLETVLVIEDVAMPFEKYMDADLESDLEFVLVTNKDLWKLEKQDALDVIELDIYEDNNSRDIYDSSISRLKATLKQNQLEIADKKLGLEYDLRSNYNAVLNKYDAVVITELELDNAKMALDTTTKRFEVGFETKNTVNAAQETLDTAELALLQSKLDYYVAVESYKDFIN